MWDRWPGNGSTYIELLNSVTEPNKVDSRRMESGILRFLYVLPIRHKMMFGVTGASAAITTVLDSLSLALMAPIVALITQSDQDLSDGQIVNWTREIFEYANLDFRLRWLIVAILVITLSRSLFLLANSWVSAWFLARYEAELRLRGYRAIMLSSWPFFLRQRVSHVINVLLEESGRTVGLFGIMNNGVGSVINLTTYLVFAILISWQLTLATVASIAVLAGLYSILSRVARELGRRTTEENQVMMAEITDGISGAKIFKSEGLEPMMLQRFAANISRRARIQRLVALNGGLFAATAEMALVGLLLGGLVLGTRVLEVPSGTVLVFSLLFFRIYQGARSLQASLISASGAVPAVAGVINLTADAERSAESDGSTEFSSLETGIEFRDVLFDYGNGNTVLENLSMNIPSGSTVALVGPSGIGKTTIIDLTIGLLQPTGGELLVDGVPLSDYSRSSWRSKLAYVSQETILFHDSVFRNIAWGRDEATEEDVYEAARMADADAFIRNMTDGYDTIIGDRGMRLSGGQRQRLALARAILRKPDLLILDEATSELDSAAEIRIQETIERIRGKTTILMAAHRLSTILTADQVCVLGNGRIVEAGTADELLAKKGAFSALYGGLANPSAQPDPPQ